MREHLGVDVDALYNEDLMAKNPVKAEDDITEWVPDHEEGKAAPEEVTKVKRKGPLRNIAEDAKETLHQGIFSVNHSNAEC
jgi:phospholipase D1/2